MSGKAIIAVDIIIGALAASLIVGAVWLFVPNAPGLECIWLVTTIAITFVLTIIQSGSDGPHRVG